MSKKLYLAGPLFSEADRNQRLLEAKQLRERFSFLDVFNPIEQPFNTNKSSLPTPQTIYDGDAQRVKDADIFLADITQYDPGVMVELGLVLTRKDCLIICVDSDIRLPDAYRYEIPTYGLNHFVLGGILKHGFLVRDFASAMDLIERKIKK